MSHPTRSSLALCACAFLAASWLAPRSAAAAPPSSLTLGLFAPSAGFGGPYASARYADALAAHLAAAIGRRVRARVFAGARQLDIAMRRGRVQLALVDPIYWASRRRRLRALSVATHGGATSRRWAVYVAAARRGRSLRRARLALAASGGAEAAVIERRLLRGTVSLGRFFGAVRRVRTAANALSAVRFGQVDAALAPVSTRPGSALARAARGLARAFTVGTLPNCVLVHAPSLDKTLIASLRSAARAHPRRLAGGGAIDGMRLIDADTRAVLVGLLAPAGPRLSLSPPPPVALPVGAVVKLPPRHVKLSSLRGYFDSR